MYLGLYIHQEKRKEEENKLKDAILQLHVLACEKKETSLDDSAIVLYIHILCLQMHKTKAIPVWGIPVYNFYCRLTSVVLIFQFLPYYYPLSFGGQ